MLKRWMVVMALLAGCATSGEVRREAMVHQQRADWAAAQGDYRRAVHEQREADRLMREADRRAWEERAGTYVPPPPPPLSPSNPVLPY